MYCNNLQTSETLTLEILYFRSESLDSLAQLLNMVKIIISCLLHILCGPLYGHFDLHIVVFALKRPIQLLLFIASFWRLAN